MHYKNRNRNSASGIVYSTNPDFDYDITEAKEEITLPPEKQNLKIRLDTKNRKGKTVTLISGFTGQKEDLRKLEKMLKSHCSAGGSSGDGEIIIQGDMREKVFNFLISKKYRVKKG